MKLDRIVSWLDATLDLAAFDEVSNNGLQIERAGNDVRLVAFAVDGSAASVRAAAEAGAQLLVVHHGISWGGGIRRLTGGAYQVVRAALAADLALYAAHLPLDANRAVGNNWELARALGLKKVAPAFSYHGNVIGVTGTLTDAARLRRLNLALPAGLKTPLKVGVCSGGAGEFAAAAKDLGCGLYITGEASWGDVIAAENVGMPMLLGGHYFTETFGVRALARKMTRELGVKTVFVGAEGEAE